MMKKRILSGILAALMLLSVFPVTMLSAETAESTGTTGETTASSTSYLDFYVTDGLSMLLDAFDASVNNKSIDLASGKWKSVLGDTNKSATLMNGSLTGHGWQTMTLGNNQMGLGYYQTVAEAKACRNDWEFVSGRTPGLDLGYANLPEGSYTLEAVFNPYGVMNDTLTARAYDQGAGYLGLFHGQALGPLKAWTFPSTRSVNNESYCHRWYYTTDNGRDTQLGMGGDNFYAAYKYSTAAADLAKLGSVMTYTIIWDLDKKGSTDTTLWTGTYSFYAGITATTMATGTVAAGEYIAKSAVDTKYQRFHLMDNYPATFYSVRVYDRVLTVAERQQNHFADIAGFYRLELGALTSLESDRERNDMLQTLGELFATATLCDSTDLTTWQANRTAYQTMLSNVLAPKVLYVTDGLEALLLAYKSFTTANTTTKTWNDALTGDAVATLNGNWTKNSMGGLSYTISGNNSNTGISLDPNSFLDNSYTVEAVGAVKGYLDANGLPVETDKEYGIAASVPTFSFGPFKAFMFYGKNDSGKYTNTQGELKDAALWDSSIRWMYSDGTKNWNDSGSAYGWGVTDKELYFKDKSVMTFGLSLTLNGEKTTAKYDLYKNGAKHLTLNYPKDKNTAVIGLEGTEFVLFRSTSASVYSLRIYNRSLTANEMKQNHVADLLFFYDVDLSDLLAASNDVRTQVMTQLMTELADIRLTEENYADTQHTVKAIFRSAISTLDNSTLYVTDGLTSLFTAYEKNSSDIDMTNGRWYDSKSDKYATLIGGQQYWQKADSGLGYSLVFSIWDANVGLSLPLTLLPKNEYTVEITADIQGVREDNGGQTGSDETFDHAVDHTMAFGALKAKQWTTPVDKNLAYPTKWYYKAGQNATYATADQTFSLNTTAFSPQQRGSRNLALTMKTEGTETTWTFYANAASQGSVSVSNATTDDNDLFRLFYQMPVTVYAIRIYDRVLTEAEQKQNHFADLVYYYGLVADLESCTDKAALYDAMMDCDFTLTAEEAQAILDFHLGYEKTITKQALTYVGLSGKLNTSSGIRSLYKVNDTLIRELEKKYNVTYGAIMGVGERNENGQTVSYNNTRDLAITGSFAEGFTASSKNSAAVVVYGTGNASYATEKYITLDGQKAFAFTTTLSPENETADWYNIGLVYAGFLTLTDKDDPTNETIIYSYAEGNTFGTASSAYGKSTSICEMATYLVNRFEGSNAEMYMYNSNARLRAIMQACGVAVERDMASEAALLASLKQDLASKMQLNTQEYKVLVCGNDQPLANGEKAIWLQYVSEFDPSSYASVKACYFYYPMHDDPTTLIDSMTAAEWHNAGYNRVFAYIAVPNNAQKGIVCVHGGGGHAYAKYAYEAYNHGYAAIAFDTEGWHATDKTGEAKASDAYSHKSKDSFSTAKEDIEQQWMYYAISDSAFANTILRSFVADGKSVGITGISWGGLTSTIASCYDQRLAFAVPIYLSYYLGYGDNTAQFGSIQNAFAADLWQAVDVLEANKVPIMIINSQKDLWADLNSSVNTFNTLQKNNEHSYLLIKPNLGHSQQEGAGIAEIYRFGDWVLSNYSNEKSFFTTNKTPSKNLGWSYSMELTVPANITDPKAVLYYTTSGITYGAGGVVNETFFAKELTLTCLRDDDNGNKVYKVDVNVPSEAYLYFISFYGSSAYDLGITPAYGSSEKYHGKIYSSSSVIVMKGNSINGK